MPNEDQSNLTISLNLAANGIFSFKSKVELLQWLSEENLFYRRLFESLPRTDENTNIQHAVEIFFRPLLNLPAPNRLDSPQNYTLQLKHSVETAYNTKQIPTSESPCGNFLASMSKTRVVYAVGYYFGIPFRIGTENREGSLALLQVQLFDLGAPIITKSATKSLNSLYTSFSQTLDIAKRQLEHQNSEFTQDLETRKQQFTNQEKIVTEKLASLSEELKSTLTTEEARVSESVTKTQEQLMLLEKVYDEKLSLQSAVVYWAKREKQHCISAWAWAAGTICVASGFTVFMFNSVKDSLGKTTIANAELWQISELATVAIFGVWTMRVFVRLMLSNTHLRTDAAERKTMMLTYLSMLRRNQLPDGDCRNLVLQSLFRPSSTGIIKDDASPPFMAGWIKCATGND